VLPFHAAGPEADSAYLAEGLVGELIARLSRLHGYGLTVLSRYATDPMHHAGRTLDEIGRELRLDYALTGTAWVRSEGFRVRAELVRTSDGAAVWSESFERPRADLERVQVEIASALAHRLPLWLPSLVHTQLSRGLYSDPRVYDAYLQARYHWGQRGREDLARALDLYRSIVAWDPGYAPAHLGVASSYLMLASWYQMAPLEAGARARESTRMALELDPDLAGAHAAQGLEESLIRWDPAAASASFRRALALDPADPDVLQFHAMHLLACGRAEKAAAELERALDLDPYSIPTRLMLALARMYAGDSRAAVAEARRAVELHRDFSPSQRTLAVVLSFVGDHEDAVEAALQGLALTPKDPMALPPLAYARARAGQLGEAREAQDEFACRAAERQVHASLGAPAALAMGDAEGALRWLERAEAQRCNWLAVLLSDPRLAPLRDAPRFRSLVRRVRRGPTGTAATAA
jgi:TolB-like protein/Tfp pilus assembly protein PilF